MKNTDAEKDQAAYILSGEIADMQLSLERAEIIVQELTDSYFAQDKETEKGKFAIMLEYDRGRIQADIVSDYLYRIRQVMEPLEEMYRRQVAINAAKKGRDGMKLKISEPETIQLLKKQAAERNLDPEEYFKSLLGTAWDTIMKYPDEAFCSAWGSV